MGRCAKWTPGRAKETNELLKRKKKVTREFSSLRNNRNQKKKLFRALGLPSPKIALLRRCVLKLALQPRCKGYLVLFFLLCIVSMLAFGLLAGLFAAPIIGSVIWFAFAASFWRHWWTAMESENRMWALLASLVVAGFLFAPDSPVCMGRSYPLSGMFFVLLAGALTHHFDRQLSRAELKGTQHMGRVKSQIFLNQYGDKRMKRVKGKMKELEELIFKIDFKFVAAKPFNFAKITSTERKIISIFEALDGDELNYVLTNIKLPHLFFIVKDHGKEHPNRTTLIDMVAVERLRQLGTTARAAVLDSIQKLRLSANENAPAWVENILTRTYGADLTMLKSRIDAKGGVENLCKVIWVDLEDPKRRGRILEHFRRQAELEYQPRLISPCNSVSFNSNQSLSNYVAEDIYDEAIEPLEPSSPSRSAPPSPRTSLPEDEEFFSYYEEQKVEMPWPPRRYRSRKILSDVDDTLLCSGGIFPAGLDSKYPKHSVYPGVLEFYKELDIGHGEGCDSGEWAGGVGNLAFLSARPHVYKDKSERKSYMKFERLVREKKMHCMPTLLPGNLVAGVRMFANDFLPMAYMKFVNFNEYATCYPECGFVFVGDNGQGDVWATEMMKQAWGDAIEGIFIKLVQPLHLTPGYGRLGTALSKTRDGTNSTTPENASPYWDDDPEKRYAKMGIVFFDTYAEAALRAAEKGLIPPCAAHRVGIATAREFPNLKLDRETREIRRQELNNDITKLDAYLAAHAPNLGAVAYIEAEVRYRVGASVRTRFGPGKVIEFRPITNTYVVELALWRLAEDMPTKLYATEDELSWLIKAAPTTRVLTPRGPGILQEVKEGRHVVVFPPARQPLDRLHRNRTEKGLFEYFGVTSDKKSNETQVEEFDAEDVSVLPAIPGDVVQTPFGKVTLLCMYAMPNRARGLWKITG